MRALALLHRIFHARYVRASVPVSRTTVRLEPNGDGTYTRVVIIHAG